MKNCPLCDSPELKITYEAANILAYCDCERCGQFRAREALFPRIAELPNRHLVAGAVREQNDRSQNARRSEASWNSLTLHDEGIENLIRMAPTSPSKRMARLLQAIESRTKYPGYAVEMDEEYCSSWAYSENDQELNYYLENMIAMGLLAELEGAALGKARAYYITPQGWSEIERLRTVGINSDQGFVAMWFSDEVKNAYEYGIKSAIEAAGYRSVRIDTEQFNDGIFDEIIASLRRSRFVVCDLTGERPNAYLEVGYAMGMGIPTILTCRKGAKTHFDLQHRNTIFWNDPGDLEVRLKNRILATIGPGPKFNEAGK